MNPPSQKFKLYAQERKKERAGWKVRERERGQCEGWREKQGEGEGERERGIERERDGERGRGREWDGEKVKGREGDSARERDGDRGRHKLHTADEWHQLVFRRPCAATTEMSSDLQRSEVAPLTGSKRNSEARHRGQWIHLTSQNVAVIIERRPETVICIQLKR